MSVLAQQQNDNDESVDGLEESRYGWLDFRPNCLQALLSSRSILVFCSILVGIQGFTVTGLGGVVISSIEKRYFLKSSEVGGIFSCYDIGSTVATLLVSYAGHSHKPKWLGCGSIILGIGCLMFAFPHVTVGYYEPIVGQNKHLCFDNQTSQNATTLNSEECRNSRWYHIFVFVIGQLLIGAGASPVYNLGCAYIDENVTRKNSGVYLGIFYAIATLGPGVGFLLGGYFLSIYIDLSLPDGVNVTPDDNSWIGAWYLGYVVAGVCALVVSIALLGFPRRTKRAKMLQEEKSRMKGCVPDERKPHNIKEFLPALKSLFQNKVFLFTTIAGSAEGFAISGMATFFPKFLESQFGLSSSNASIYSGLVIIPGGIIGMLIGGYLIRRFKWNCGQCAKACTIIAFLAIFPILIFLNHCPNMNFAGVTTSYNNRTHDDAIDRCSSQFHCNCKQYDYVPVCNKQHSVTYFSPCHAGCSVEIETGGVKVYTNCSCLPSNVSMAYKGSCDQSCESLPYFLIIFFLLLCLTFCNNIPAITVTLRCVPESQGSFALGVQQIISRIFAFIPAPIVYGVLLDSVCILSESDPCDEHVDRNCLEYKNDGLGNVFLGATMLCKTLSLFFFGLAWLVYKSPTDVMECRESTLDLQDKDNHSEENISSTSL